MHWINDYIGKPWQQNACGPNAFDCWGLILDIYRQRLSIELPTIVVDPYSVKGAAKALTQGCNDACSKNLVGEVEQDYQDFDIIMVKNKTVCYHVGLIVGGRVLHVAHNDSKGVVLDRLESFKQVAGNYTVYRWLK